MVAGSGDAESECEYAGTSVGLRSGYHECGGSDTVDVDIRTAVGEQPVQDLVCRLLLETKEGAGSASVPAIHEHSGVLESDGPHVVRRAAGEIHAAFLARLDGDEYVLLVEGRDDRHRDRRTQSGHDR